MPVPFRKRLLGFKVLRGATPRFSRDFPHSHCHRPGVTVRLTEEPNRICRCFQQPVSVKGFSVSERSILHAKQQPSARIRTFPMHNKFILREIYTVFILFIAQFLEIATNVFDTRR